MEDFPCFEDPQKTLYPLAQNVQIKKATFPNSVQKKKKNANHAQDHKVHC